MNDDEMNDDEMNDDELGKLMKTIEVNTRGLEGISQEAIELQEFCDSMDNRLDGLAPAEREIVEVQLDGYVKVLEQHYCLVRKRSAMKALTAHITAFDALLVSIVARDDRLLAHVVEMEKTIIAVHNALDAM